MAIWVRSQDKKTLVEVKSLEITYRPINESFWIVGDEVKWLAKYNTEAEALEVLNNIQEWLKTCDKSVHQVYEMPQDS